MASLVRVLAEGGRARTSALVVAFAVGGAWLADGVVEAAVSAERTFGDAMLRPTAREIWARLAVAILLMVLQWMAAARRRALLLSSALAKAPDGVQITSLDGIVAYSNEAVRDIFGFSTAELLGKHVNAMNADPTFATRVILPELARNGRWAGELEVKHKDGHTFPIWLTTSLVRDGRQRPIAAIGVIRDVSERKRSEQALRDYAHRLEDATALKDLFADILRHDLLGPATTLQLSLDALLKRDADPAAARRMIEGARRSCGKLIEMIEGAATYAKLSTAKQLEFGDVDLGAVLHEIVEETELRRQERGARVAIEVPGECRVRANPMISDVFENLVSNALKYGAAGGTIRIAVREDRDRWCVSVADSGEGIADADKRKLFTRFERLRKEGVKGTGLGLAIAKRIVDLHGGAIWVEDNPEGGSVFCVSLRKKGPPATAPPP